MNFSHQLERLLAQALTLRVAVALGASTLVTAGVAGPLALQARNAQAEQQVLVEGETLEADVAEGETALTPDPLPVIPAPPAPTSEVGKVVDNPEPTLELAPEPSEASTNETTATQVELTPTPTTDEGPSETEPSLSSEDPTTSVSSTTSTPPSGQETPPSLSSEPVASTTTERSTTPSSTTTAPTSRATTTTSTTIAQVEGPGGEGITLPTPNQAPTTTTTTSRAPTTTEEPPPTTERPPTTEATPLPTVTTTTEEPTSTTVADEGPTNTEPADSSSPTTTAEPTPTTEATDPTVLDPTEPTGAPTTVDSGLPGEILWSTVRTGVGEDSLDDAVLTGPVFIHLGRSPDIAAVLIWLDDPAGETVPILDSSRPFTSLLQTEALANGPHRLDVQITTLDGDRFSLTANFAVDVETNTPSEVDPTTSVVSNTT